MATIVFTDAKAYYGGYNLSGYSNEGSLALNPVMLDSTVFGLGGTRRFQPGLFDFKAMLKGYMDYTFPIASPNNDAANSLDTVLFSAIGGPTTVFTLAPLGNAEGDIAYTMQRVSGRITPLSGPVGGLLPFELDSNPAAGTRAVRATVGGLGLKTVTGGTATGISLGAVSSSQRLYAAMHVVSQSGTTPTLDVTVRSSTVIGMGSPTTRLTFPQFTTSVGSSWQSIAGPITDTFFDVRWTLAGTTPNYTIFVVVGIA